MTKDIYRYFESHSPYHINSEELGDIEKNSKIICEITKPKVKARKLFDLEKGGIY